MNRWHYFPRTGDVCLIGVQGYGLIPGSGREASGNAPECVTFTVCENFPPFREVLTLQPVSVARAPGKREALIREHINQRYRSAPSLPSSPSPGR